MAGKIFGNSVNMDGVPVDPAFAGSVQKENQGKLFPGLSVVGNGQKEGKDR